MVLLMDQMAPPSSLKHWQDIFKANTTYIVKTQRLRVKDAPHQPNVKSQKDEAVN